MSSKKRRKRVVAPLPDEGGISLPKVAIKPQKNTAKSKIKAELLKAKKNRLYKAKSEISQNIKQYRETTKGNKQLKIEIPKGYMKAWNLAGKRNVDNAKIARGIIRDYIKQNTKISGQWLYSMGYEPGSGILSDADPSSDVFLELFLGENEMDRYGANKGYTLSEFYKACRKSDHPDAMKMYRYVSNLFNVELRKALYK